MLRNLDRAEGGIGAGEMPTGARQGRNAFATIGYGGPCPREQLNVGEPDRVFAVNAQF
jgi:phosphatidylethanolamine-binding protein (PEBP) family uncharacterized protein